MRSLDLIVIHCAASPNGEWRTIADIDAMHAARGFRRDPKLIGYNAPDYPHVGYHYVIYTSGGAVSGRGIEEIGAHVKGHNANSIGVYMVGTDRFTAEQWTTLRDNICATVATIARRRGNVVKGRLTPFEAVALARTLNLRIVGHRDLSPDVNGDGTVEPQEWLKTCPGFSVADWLAGGMEPLAGHILEDA